MTTRLGIPEASTVSDRLAIQDVLNAYAEGIDARDWTLVLGVFTPDAVVDYTAVGGPRCGPTDLVDWLEEVLGQTPLTDHFMLNSRIRVEGDAATAITSLLNPFFVPGGREAMLFGGRYRDSLVRTGDGWRIHERLQTTTWQIGPAPARILRGLDDIDGHERPPGGNG